MQSAGVWMFNPWASTLTGSPYYTDGPWWRTDCFIPHSPQIQQHTQHWITHIPAQRPGHLHLVISCIFTDQTLTEVWTEDEWQETKLLIPQEVTKTFNRTFYVQTSLGYVGNAYIFAERMWLDLYSLCRDVFEENQQISPIRQQSVQSSKYANKCK